MPDRDGIKLLLEPARGQIPRLSHLWPDAGYEGRGEERARQELGLNVEGVHRSPKPEPEKMLRMWAKKGFEEGRNIDPDKLFPRRRVFEVLPRRRVTERTFAWVSATTVR